MASFQPYNNHINPWRARRKRGETEYYLGYWPSREQAEEIERKFDEHWPGVRTTFDVDKSNGSKPSPSRSGE